MSFLSSQGQLNTIVSQEAVAAGGGATTVADILYTTGAFIYPAGLYLVSFTTVVGGAITSGFLELQSGGVDFGQTQMFGPGTYTLTAPVYLNGTTSNIVLTASGTGATYTTSASKLFVIRLP